MVEFHDLLILMVVVWTAGKIFRNFHLPVVFGELLGGILVGPALLGIIHPESHTIQVLAELGIFFLMLHAGLETDPDELFNASKKGILVALAGFLLPFGAGFWVAYAFGQTMIASLFIALTLSISSIALASRLFKDLKIEKTKIAHLTLGAAILSDILGLVILSVLLSLAENGSVEVASVLWLLTKIILFFSVVIVGGNKVARFLNQVIYIGNKGFTLTLIIALLMGLVAESIGLHMIIGAFLAGLFMREECLDQKVFDKIEDRVYGLSYGFFGPIFFASLAFHLDFTAITTVPLFLGLIILVAIAGKLLGSGLTARLTGFTKCQSTIIGLAMNNRGAVDLIIASIGLQMGIIDRNVFSVLVLMAFVTTLFSIITMPPFAKRLRA